MYIHNNFGQQIHRLTEIIKSEDIKSYAGNAFYKLISMVIYKDVFSGIEAGKSIGELLFHMPTMLFWDNMRHLLEGTFKSFNDQVKMAAKFNEDNDDYYRFVKKIVYLVNELNDDEKIDYFSCLTRCFLLTDLHESLYFKLAQLLQQCTVYELEYIRKCPLDFQSGNTIIVSVLQLYGLFVQQGDAQSHAYYELTDLAKALKNCCLNFNDEGHKFLKYTQYDNLEAIPQNEPVTVEDINEMFKIGTFDGGDEDELC